MNTANHASGFGALAGFWVQYLEGMSFQTGWTGFIPDGRKSGPKSSKVTQEEASEFRAGGV